MKNLKNNLAFPISLVFASSVQVSASSVQVRAFSVQVRASSVQVRAFYSCFIAIRTLIDNKKFYSTGNSNIARDD